MTISADPRSLLDLPLETLVVLASGYLAYRLAFTGRDTSHQPTDVVFATFVFAAVARLVIALVPDPHLHWWSPSIMYLLALGTALCVAAIWRKTGEDKVFEFLRWAGISMSDRHKTAFETMISRGGYKPTQLVVRKTDGTVVMCERLQDFAKSAFGPCLLAPDGSVALYITDFKSTDETKWETILTVSKDWGPAITYIPASQIKEIEIRYPASE